MKSFSQTLGLGLALLTLTLIKAKAVEPLDTAVPAKDFYCTSLGVELRPEVFKLPEFGEFTGMRLISAPADDSPLRQLGLKQGDVLARINGVWMDSPEKLENLHGWRLVRCLRNGAQTMPQEKVYFLPRASLRHHWGP